jgi:hypothetical protein
MLTMTYEYEGVNELSHNSGPEFSHISELRPVSPGCTKVCFCSSGRSNPLNELCEEKMHSVDFDAQTYCLDTGISFEPTGKRSNIRETVVTKAAL